MFKNQLRLIVKLERQREKTKSIKSRHSETSYSLFIIGNGDKFG